MRPGESLLAVGFICAAMATSLCPFVMIGLLGVALLPLAFKLLALGGVFAHEDAHAPGWQRLLGAVLHVAGAMGLLATALSATLLASDFALASRRGASGPSPWHWAVLGLISLLPALTITLGLHYGARWPWTRCKLWGVAAWCVTPAALVLFLVLSPRLPLTA